MQKKRLKSLNEWNTKKKAKKREKNSIAVCTKLRGETTTMDDRVAVASTKTSSHKWDSAAAKKVSAAAGLQISFGVLNFDSRTHTLKFDRSKVEFVGVLG